LARPVEGNGTCTFWCILLFMASKDLTVTQHEPATTENMLRKKDILYVHDANE